MNAGEAVALALGAVVVVGGAVVAVSAIQDGQKAKEEAAKANAEAALALAQARLGQGTSTAPRSSGGGNPWADVLANGLGFASQLLGKV